MKIQKTKRKMIKTLKKINKRMSLMMPRKAIGKLTQVKNQMLIRRNLVKMMNQMIQHPNLYQVI